MPGSYTNTHTLQTGTQQRCFAAEIVMVLVLLRTCSFTKSLITTKRTLFLFDVNPYFCIHIVQVHSTTDRHVHTRYLSLIYLRSPNKITYLIYLYEVLTTYTYFIKVTGTLMYARNCIYRATRPLTRLRVKGLALSSGPLEFCTCRTGFRIGGVVFIWF